jgi:mitogen-activated protein kinase 1/3
MEVIPPESFDSFGDVIFVTDLMEADLRDILNSNQPLTDQHVQYCKFYLLVTHHPSHVSTAISVALYP